MKIVRSLSFVLLAILVAGFVAAPAQAQCFLPPTAPKIQSQPCIYTTDSVNNRVVVFSAVDGSFLFSFGSTGTLNGQFKAPIGITAAVDGSVIVADSGNSRIQVFDANGNFIRQFGNSGTGPGKLITPTGVAVDSRFPYQVYVSDFANNRVAVFNSTGNFLYAFGSTGTGNGQFKGPWGINVSLTGALFVTDQNNSRVQMFDTAGNFLAKFGAVGTGPGNLIMPTGITSAIDDRCIDCCNDCGAPATAAPQAPDPDFPILIMVADAANNRVNVYEVSFNFATNRWTFQFLYKFGSTGTGPGQLSSPLGLWAVPDFTGEPVGILVADGNNHRPEIFLADITSAAFELRLGGFGTGPGQFVTPAGVTVTVQLAP